MAQLACRVDNAGDVKFKSTGIVMQLLQLSKSLILMLSATLALSAQEADPQTWTIDGNRVVAKFSAMVAGNLLFRDAGGKEIKTTMNALPFDQQRSVMKLSGWGREWNDATFKHTTLAALFDVGPNSVVLEKSDGTKITVPLEKLSASDRNYVKKWVKPTVPIASLPSVQAIPDPPETNKPISADPSIVEWQNAPPAKKSRDSSSRTSSSNKKWYDGGTLHDASALEWQKASAANKLATCADLVTVLKENDALKASISIRITSTDSLKPFAAELVDFLDAAFKPDPDSETNYKMFANQTVSGHTAIGIVLMRWNR